jgi:alpha-galactosidase/6-phospho-beta-glucosidase family protein
MRREKMHMRTKIVIVGGGSIIWAPNIVKDMLLTDELADAEFVLYDVDRAASDLVASFLRKLNKRLGTSSTFTSTSNRARAFSDANYFVITITTGGLKAMAYDLSIPEEYGIYHTVGDTAGPGGWARTLRNYPVFEELAGDINHYAPGAMVLNYTNPMATLTAALARLCMGPVVGLCHGLFENLDFLTRFYQLPKEICVNYAGLNHFFWIPQVIVHGIDVTADLLVKVRRRGFTALYRVVNRNDERRCSSHELATALFDETGVIPYLADRHTCEFFPTYITNRDIMKRYRLVRTTVDERLAMYRQRRSRLKAMIYGDIPDEFMHRSRETAADIVAASITGKPFIDVGNTPNNGQVSNLPRGTIVETAVRVDQNGFTPLCFGDLPRHILAYVEPYVHVFDTTVRACIERDATIALRALRMDPVCSRLTGDQVREMGKRLLAANMRFMCPRYRGTQSAKSAIY